MKINLTGHKKKVLACTLALILCIAVVAVTGKSGEVMPHDGDVLVDSLNVSEITTDGVEKGAVDDSSLVTSDDITELENKDSYFDEMRATIDMDRNQVLAMLTDVIEEAATEKEKDNATAQKLKIIDYMDKEKIIENLISTKGLPECLVLLTDNAVNVTVNKDDLVQSDVAKICDVVMRETGRSASQIVIQSKF